VSPRRRRVSTINLGDHNERRWLRHVHATPDLLSMFPAMLAQSGYHRRLKTAQPLLCNAIITLAACCPSWFDDLWITDAPVPSGMSRETWCLATPTIGDGRCWPPCSTTTVTASPLATSCFAGGEFKRLTEAMGLRLLRPDRKDGTYRNGGLGGVRSRSIRLSKVSSTSNGTLDVLRMACSPASRNASWPWLPASGTTGKPA
jgi:hypothetical protein